MKSEPCYRRTIVHRSKEFEIVSIEWDEGSVSTFHHHNFSQCMVMVKQGLFQNEVDLGVSKETSVLRAGEVMGTPLGADHEVRCLKGPGETLHVYLPRIQEVNPSHFSGHVKKNLWQKIKLSESLSLTEVEKLLGEIKDNCISTSSVYFNNQLFSGIMPHTLMAQSILDQTRTTMATFEASPIFSLMEQEIVSSLGQQLGWSQAGGLGVPGGSMANWMAMHLARTNHNVQSIKLGSSNKQTIFVSKEAHYSFKKGATVLGFGTDHLISVEVDGEGRMCPLDLRKKIGESRRQGLNPIMVAATCGTTVLGAFDPLEELADICQEEALWLHADGAWGGPALFSNQLKSTLLRGVERVDSFAFDAHKLFGANLTSSFFLCQHPQHLVMSNDTKGGEYLFHSQTALAGLEQDLGRMSWQCGRSFDGLAFWTLWKNLGHHGLGEFVDRLYAIKQQVVSWIKSQERLELIIEPSYLNICVKIKPHDGEYNPFWSKVVREYLKQSNIALVNYVEDQSHSFLRIVLTHPKTTVDNIRFLLESALRVRKEDLKFSEAPPIEVSI